MQLRKLLKSLRKQISLSKNLDKESLEQKAEGYQIFMKHALTAVFILYREADKILVIDAQFDGYNNTDFSVKSLEHWFEPRGEKLSQVEYEKAVARMIKFYSHWGDVTLNESPVRTINEIIADLNSRGIDYINLEDS